MAKNGATTECPAFPQTPCQWLTQPGSGDVCVNCGRLRYERFNRTKSKGGPFAGVKKER